MAICKAWVMPYDCAISAAPIGKNFRTQRQLCLDCPRSRFGRCREACQKFRLE
jgi:hypothetical protein